jgi:large subunit ribosomal protein L17
MAQRKLGRTSNKRRAMLRALVTDLIIYGRIETTEMRAKEVKRIADKMVTLGKKNNLAARRQAASFLLNKVAKTEEKEVNVNVREEGKITSTTTKTMNIDQTAVQKLFEEVAPKYADRNGGYTRVIKMAPRRGDNAPMAIIEFI